MATRDTFVEVADGDQLNQGFYNGIYELVNPLGDVGEPSSYGSVDASVTTAETEIGEIAITADEVQNGVLVTAVIESTGCAAGDTASVRIRTGTSSTATANTLRVTSEFKHSGTGNTIIQPIVINWFCNEETLTSAWNIHITGQLSGATGGVLTLKSLTGLKL